MRGLAIVFCISILLSGCSSSNEVQISDQSYFPLRVGDFRIYQVNATGILRLKCNDDGETLKIYQLKELISDSVKNVEGGYTYTIHHYTRPDSTHAWVDLETWTARTNSNQVVVNESNIPYVKFIFPLVEKTVWNINSYNSLRKDYDTLRNLHQSFVLTNGNIVQNTFSARRDSVDLILYYYKRKEVYAASIGLIYKEDTQLQYFDNSDFSCYGHQVAKSGSTYVQSLISYGHQ